MSNTDMTPGKASVKTIAIRLEPELHAQLQVIAQLLGSTITDEIRQAIEAHVESKRSAPELAAQASNVLENIEREAEARRDAIAALFGGEDPKPAPSTTPTSGRSRGRKAATDDPASDS